MRRRHTFQYTSTYRQYCKGPSTEKGYGTMIVSIGFFYMTRRPREPVLVARLAYSTSLDNTPV